MSTEARNAIITGAARGLGRALAVQLARDGWHICVSDIDESGALETVEQVVKAGGTGQFEKLDVSDFQQWETLRDRLQPEWSQLDLLVNNAGVCGAGEVGSYPAEDWHWMLDVNLTGPIYGCHAMLDWLKANPRQPHIVNIASIAGMVTGAALGAYSVSKSGVISLSETLYAELKHEGVGVTVVCPGFFDSDLFRDARWSNSRAMAEGERFMRNARITAEDVAEQIVRAVRRRRLYVVHGARARWLWRLKRWFPGTFNRLMAHAYRKWLRQKTNRTRRRVREIKPEGA